MSTALRHPETEIESSVATMAPSAPPVETAPEQWREFSPYVETFTGAVSESEAVTRRAKQKAHRKFHVSGAFCAGTLLFGQLLGLVYLYSLDLTATRAASKLDESIRQTRLQISLTEMKLASAKSSPKLSTWAGELGYREADLNEMDDVTSNSPMPAPSTSAGGNSR